MPVHAAVAALSPSERAQWEADRPIITTQPDWRDAEDEEILAGLARRIATTKRWQTLLTAMGMDVDASVRELEALLAGFTRAAADADAAVESHLHAAADLAEKRYALFKMLDASVSAAYEINPFDPLVQELKEELDEWRGQFPKE